MSRTPMHHPNLEGVSSYFEAAEESDDDVNAGAADEIDDEAELKQLVQNPSIGFGGISNASLVLGGLLVAIAKRVGLRLILMETKESEELQSLFLRRPCLVMTVNELESGRMQLGF
jgi:hypothetical protein